MGAAARLTDAPVFVVSMSATVCGAAGTTTGANGDPAGEPIHGATAAAPIAEPPASHLSKTKETHQGVSLEEKQDKKTTGWGHTWCSPGTPAAMSERIPLAASALAPAHQRRVRIWPRNGRPKTSPPRWGKTRVRALDPCTAGLGCGRTAIINLTQVH